MRSRKSTKEKKKQWAKEKGHKDKQSSTQDNTEK
jgi:hypothetical protein